jgi:hypothetical protein
MFALWHGLVSLFLGTAHHPKDERHQKEDQEDVEQYFGNPGRSDSDAAKAQNACQQCDDKEYGCPVQHIILLSQRAGADASALVWVV